jgi:hypothetical protein
MWPRERLLGQVPQALHEGRVAIVKASGRMSVVWMNEVGQED